MIIWIRCVVAFNLHLTRHRLWRVCEGQTKNYVAPLVETVDELDVLESILESSKPPYCAEDPRHFLLSTPFRYAERTPGGSRFIAHGATGAMYAGEVPEVCFREAGHWAYHRFVRQSEGLSSQTFSLRRTLFSFDVSGAAIDLFAPPFDVDAAAWLSPDNYVPCQRMGSAARQAGIDLIRYRSVRDPDHRAAMVVLADRPIVSNAPASQEDFDLFIGKSQVAWRGLQSRDQYTIAI
ncbi:RES family NAD+ phosphorylase [Burkholderiaceae bacterium DAT-1]|nr:RES family NAD+ phosphorylase [Burkholderiaceae bacterium DAT-1]